MTASQYLKTFSEICCCIASVMSHPVRPLRRQPTRLLHLGFSRQEHWSGLPFPSPMHACMLSRFSHVWLYATLWTAAHQAPLSTGFSRQEYWSGLPLYKMISMNVRFCYCIKKVVNIGKICITPNINHCILIYWKTNIGKPIYSKWPVHEITESCCMDKRAVQSINRLTDGF